MAAAIDLSTAGIRIGIAYEATSGTRPTTGYVNIPEPKSIPAMDEAPSLLDTTSLNAEQYKTYIPGLNDLNGGDIAITFNCSQVWCDFWDTMYETNESNKASNKRAWIEFYIPGLTDAFYMPVDIVKRGQAGAEVDGVLEITGHFTPIGEPDFYTAVNPTDPVSA